MLRKLLTVAVTACSIYCTAQDTISKISTNRCIVLIDENDFYMNTDRYYTGGSFYGAILPVLSKWPVMKALPHLSGSTTQYGMSLVQNCFTPINLRSDSIQYGDHPYAGALFISSYSQSANTKTSEELDAQADIGAVGECSYCKEIQEDIHHWLADQQPRGWQYQVANTVYFNYRLKYERGFVVDSGFTFSGISEINAGDFYDNLYAGADMHFGKMQPHFSINHSKKFQLFGYVSGGVRAVGYNSSLEGTLFVPNIYTLPYSAIEPIVFQWSYGFTISYRNLSFNYYSTFITREIKAGYPFAWGHANLMIYF